MIELKEKFLKATHGTGDSYLLAKPDEVLEMLKYEIENAEPGETFAMEVVEEYPSVVRDLPEFDGF